MLSLAGMSCAQLKLILEKGGNRLGKKKQFLPQLKI